MKKFLVSLVIALFSIASFAAAVAVREEARGTIYLTDEPCKLAPQGNRLHGVPNPKYPDAVAFEGCWMEVGGDIYVVTDSGSQVVLPLDYFMWITKNPTRNPNS